MRALTHTRFCRNDSNIRGGGEKAEEFEISNFSPSGHDSTAAAAAATEGGRLSKKGAGYPPI